MKCNSISRKAILSFIFILSNGIVLFSQGLNTNYHKLSNYQPEEKSFDKLCCGYDSIYKSITYREKKENKVMKEALTGNKKHLSYLAENKLLMEHDSITDYLQGIVNRVQQKNSILAGKKLKVFTYRTIEPNAANHGNGIILFNLSLLAKFEKEENVAFILCHEIGHDIRGHVIDGIRKNYEIENSADLKKQYDKLKTQEFNKFRSYEKYIATYLSRLSSRKREMEVQADSVGLFLYHNAGYEKQYAFETMERLDSVDFETNKTKIDYVKFFDSPNFPFKKSWLEPEEQEETIDGGNLKDVKYPDSLKTHPDCKIRLEKLKEINLKEGKTHAYNSNYSNINQLCQFEMLEVYLDEFEYSQGFYNSLQLATTYPNNQYLKCSVANFLFEIYSSKVDHYFSIVTDKPDAKFDAGYLECLNFINNTNSETQKKLLENYFKKNFDTNISDAYTGYVLTLLKSIGKNKTEQALLVEEYKTYFGDNSYLLKLKTKFIPKK